MTRKRGQNRILWFRIRWLFFFYFLFGLFLSSHPDLVLLHATTFHSILLLTEKGEKGEKGIASSLCPPFMSAPFLFFIPLERERAGES